MATLPKATPVANTGTTRDESKLDSLGNEKKIGDAKDDQTLGPRGVDVPPDVMTEAQKLEIADKREARLAAGMSSTDKSDSTGKPKGHFAATAQGVDKHGMRIPDKIDYTKPVEAHPALVGPRGAGAPLDTFHGKRPAPKV